MNTIINREHWLTEAAKPLTGLLKNYAGVTVPQFRVSCGFTGSRIGMRAIGVAWSAGATKDDVAQVYISPLLDDSSRVLDVLLHELIHVGVGNQHGHKGPFKRAAKLVGLKGKMTATVASDKLKNFLEKVIVKLGAYPHAAIKTQPRVKGIGKGRPVVVIDPTTGAQIIAGSNKLLKLVDVGSAYSLWVEARFLTFGFPQYQGRTMILRRQS